MRWSPEGGRTADVLLVDDNEDDVILARMAFERLKLPIRLHCVADGAACLRYLRREPPWTDARVPDLVLLDLNMPVLDGHATLAAIRAEEALRHLAVVIFTTSSREEDITASYGLQCAGYVVKPVGIEELFTVIEQIAAYWFSAATLPKRAPCR